MCRALHVVFRPTGLVLQLVTYVTYKTISISEPAYLHSPLKHYVPSRSLRSSDSNLLSVPRVRTCVGFRSFAVAAPNNLEYPPFRYS